MKRLVAPIIIAVIAAAAPVSADPPVAEEYTITCKPTESAVFPGSRVHVKCDKPWKNPSTGAKAWYFAIAASDPAAPMVQEAGDTAIGHGKKVTILFRSSSTDNPAGCGTSDCRKLVGIVVDN